MRTHVNHLPIVFLLEIIQIIEIVFKKLFLTTCFLDSIAGLFEMREYYVGERFIHDCGLELKLIHVY